MYKTVGWALTQQIDTNNNGMRFDIPVGPRPNLLRENMILTNNQLDESQLNAVDQLATECLKVDGGLPGLHRYILEQERTLDNNVFYYQDDHLIGFLSIYFFYEDTCEIGLIISPNSRRKGLAKQLIQSILPRLKANNITGLLFSTAANVNSHWLREHGFLYKNTDYQMQRKSSTPILNSNQQLTIRQATETDISIMCAIDKASFAVEQENLSYHLHRLLYNAEYTILVASLHETIIGKAHIYWRKNDAFLSDIAILPDYQGQGWGGQLIAYCINEALNRGVTTVSLDVEAINQSALNIYKRHGFEVSTAREYWFISISRLQKKLD